MPSARLRVRTFVFAKSGYRDLTHFYHFVHASPPLGPVKTADLTMLGFTVPNQAFSALLWFSS
jgi:hypothetical protein